MEVRLVVGVEDLGEALVPEGPSQFGKVSRIDRRLRHARRTRIDRTLYMPVDRIMF